MNPQNSPTYWAGGFLYDPGTKKILLHKRDGNTSHNPNKWAFFGGGNLSGEMPKETFVREFKEETEIDLPPGAVKFFRVHDDGMEIPHHVLFAQIEDPVIRLHEGADYGWFTLLEARELDLVPLVRDDVEIFFLDYEIK